MLAQVARNDAAGTPTVFLAWEPHPMNLNFEITYLTGGDEEFGPNFGSASIHTLARKEWVAECPNAARLFTQLVFETEMENQLIADILDNGTDPRDAAKEWIAANPQVLDTWLDGVTTLDGQPGADAMRASLN